MTNKRVLYCEDIPGLAFMFQEASEILGVDAKTVENPKLLLEEIASGHFDLIIIDMNNIRQTSSSNRLVQWEVVRKIRDEAPSSTIIGISGYQVSNWREEDKKEFDRVISKLDYNLCMVGDCPSVIGLESFYKEQGIL